MMEIEYTMNDAINAYNHIDEWTAPEKVRPICWLLLYITYVELCLIVDKWTKLSEDVCAHPGRYYM